MTVVASTARERGGVEGTGRCRGKVMSGRTRPRFCRRHVVCKAGGNDYPHEILPQPETAEILRLQKCQEMKPSKQARRGCRSDLCGEAVENGKSSALRAAARTCAVLQFP